MNFKQYIETKYDVRERIQDLKKDPVESFIKSDIFPCDYVQIENGEMIKMLYYANNKKEIAVLDLLSYKREDLVKLKDKDLLELYDTYTEQFEFEGIFDLSKLSTIRDKSLDKNRLLDK